MMIKQYLTLFYFLLLVVPSVAQDITLFSSIYNLTTEKSNSSQEYSANDINALSLNTGLGVFVDFKNWTLYNEVVMDYDGSESITRYHQSSYEILEEEFPATTFFKTRLGLGKTMKAAKLIQARFITYLGYEHKNHRIRRIWTSRKYENNNVKKQEINERPREQTYEIGIKTNLEYACTKLLYVGVGFDFYFQMIKQGGQASSLTHYYDDFGVFKYTNIIEIDHNSTSFNSSFFNVSMYLSYKIKQGK